MKEGNCQICGKKTEKLWVLNTAMYDNLELTKQRIRADICEKCAADIGEVVNRLKKLSQEPDSNRMQKAFNEAMAKKKLSEPSQKEPETPQVKKDEKKPEPKTTEKPETRYQPQRNKGFAQNEFLKTIHHSQEEIEILGVGNEIWRGTLNAYDDYSLVLKTKSGKELIFKHAIKSVKPAKKETFNASVRSFSKINPAKS
ncbi:RNA chaperone Hfq [Candidatus Oleimmundimicrobium sp.]|uniref:RNA chaperone Hfq n=1 Tax=Candidatus Oleimmundimicrobium sp. TaxID=3060597 RepID=UPI0027193DEE|nr:RNA chaperone Hfq [Candidatus Oleimmundimicrobium sp.]MDO8885636.1 RNA chaperone Hfq [Candidatus Oleimmundimicrobium sp.]